MKSDIIDIKAEAIHTTDKAILISTDGEDRVWLPLSKVEIEKTNKANRVVVSIPESLAIEKGLV